MNKTQQSLSTGLDIWNAAWNVIILAGLQLYLKSNLFLEQMEEQEIQDLGTAEASRSLQQCMDFRLGFYSESDSVYQNPTLFQNKENGGVLSDLDSAQCADFIPFFSQVRCLLLTAISLSF